MGNSGSMIWSQLIAGPPFVVPCLCSFWIWIRIHGTETSKGTRHGDARKAFLSNSVSMIWSPTFKAFLSNSGSMLWSQPVPGHLVGRSLFAFVMDLGQEL